MTYHTSVKQRFITLRAQGNTLHAIARELRVHPNTLFRWNHEFKAEIAARHALELDALAEQFYTLKARRISLFGRQLDRLLANLDKYNLDEVPRAKLLDLVLKYAAALKREEEDLQLPTLDLTPNQSLPALPEPDFDPTPEPAPANEKL